MIKRLLWRGFVGLCFALPMGFLAVAAVQARSFVQEAPETQCQNCHSSIQTHWAESAHGQAASSPTFQIAWQEQGSPDQCLSCHTTGYDPTTGSYEAEGVTCAVCHQDQTGNHPDSVMPTEISSRLCGSCHVDTFAEWGTSAHGREELACIRCHNPHTTELKKDDVEATCKACHNEETHFYSFTGHAQEGIPCTDCHLQVTTTPLGDGHGQHKHTFTAELSTCVTCHGENMHYPTGNEMNAAAGDQLVETDMSMPLEHSVVTAQPEPVSPIGFAVVAALVGMGSGIVLAPWLENRYRQSGKEQ